MKKIVAWIVGIFLVFGFLWSTPFVYAANITNVTDVVSRTLVSTAADQTIRATMPSALTTVGDTIQIVFPAEFTVPTLVPSDVSLTYGPSTGLETTATLAASPAAGVWGVMLSGRALIFTVPTDAGVSGLPPNSKIIISFGTHVVGGTQQITNPASPGLYRFLLSTPYESTSFSVEILASDSLTVTATVPSTSSPSPAPTPPSGGASAGPAGEPPAPTPTLGIINLRVEDIRTDQATVTWTSSAEADGQVEYGQTLSYGGLTREGVGYVTNHRITMSGLFPDRDYYGQVRSQSVAGLIGTQTFSFRTRAIPRTPVVTLLRATSITDRSAIILFDTDIDAIGTVSLAPSGVGVFSETIPLRTHAISLTGLRPGVSYSASVTARESTGLTSVPAIVVFRTEDDRTPPPNPLNAAAIGLTRSIRVSWSNPPLEDGDYLMVRAGTFRPPTSITEGRLVYAGRDMTVTDTGLLDATIYFYTVFALDTAGNPSSGAITNARTLSEVPIPEPVPPVPVPVPSPIPVPTPVPTIPPTPGTTPSVPAARPGGGVTPTTPGGTGATPTGGTTPSSGTEGGTAGAVPSTPGSLGGPISGGGEGGTIIPLTPAIETPVAPTATLSPLESISTTTEGVIVSALPEESRAHVYVAQGALELLSFNGVRTVLPARTMTFRISLTADGQVPVGGQLRIGDSTYLLAGSPGEGHWEATVVAPTEIRDTTYEILLQYPDGSRRSDVGTIRTRSLGIVREGALTGRDRAPILSGATVEVLREDGSRWNAEPFQEQNPMRTDASGTFGFLLPQGRYRIRVSKAGFRTFERAIEVQDQVLALPISLTKELIPLKQLFRADASLGENAQAALQEAGIAAQIVRDISQTPEVQAATQVVVAPTAAAATVVVTATAVSSASAVNYIRFFFTQPFLLIRRRKRKKWGVIYNALSKQPIELAIVRLVHAASGVVVQTRITDAQGRFSFLPLPGQYRIQVLKPSYVYPSAYLKSEKEDGDFLDLYHGEPITTQEGALLTPNIPIDPVVREETPARIIWRGRLRHAQSAIGVLGTIVSVGAFIIAPSAITGGLFALQLGSYALFRRLAIPPKPKDWGITYDEDSKQPIEQAIIRVFDKKFNKLLETQITDRKGKYGFFTGKGLYYLTAEKPGYTKYTSTDIDLRNAKEAIIDQRVALSKRKAAT